MNTPQTISTTSLNDTCILAIDALDSLVTDLVKAHRPKPLPDFLDWIADEVTPFVETVIKSTFDESRFKKSLEMGHPKIAMLHWVRHWVKPGIVSKYPELAEHFVGLSKAGNQGHRNLENSVEIAVMSAKMRLTNLRRTR